MPSYIPHNVCVCVCVKMFVSHTSIDQPDRSDACFWPIWSTAPREKTPAFFVTEQGVVHPPCLYSSRTRLFHIRGKQRSRIPGSTYTYRETKSGIVCCFSQFHPHLYIKHKNLNPTCNPNDPYFRIYRQEYTQV